MSQRVETSARAECTCTRLNSVVSTRKRPFTEEYQLLAHGRWFSPGTPASSTTKTGRYDIAEILLKVALKTKNQIKSMKVTCIYSHTLYNVKQLVNVLFTITLSFDFLQYSNT